MKTVYIVLINDAHGNITVEKVFNSEERAIQFADECPENEEAEVEAHEVQNDEPEMPVKPA